jgi:hypothetical protein
MESIKKYVERFFKTTKRNLRYSVSLGECKEVVDAVRNVDEFDGIFVLADFFEFGYAKGYRAAMEEMKKGGATA